MMKNAKLFFNIGAWMFVLIGLGHILAVDLFRSVAIHIEGKDQLMQVMAASDVIIFGDYTNMRLAFNGFSLTGGFILFCFGALNLIFGKASIETILSSRSILGLNIGASLFMFIVSLNHFWYGGDLAFGLALLAFILAYVFKPASGAELQSLSAVNSSGRVNKISHNSQPEIG